MAQSRPYFGSLPGARGQRASAGQPRSTALDRQPAWAAAGLPAAALAAGRVRALGAKARAPSADAAAAIIALGIEARVNNEATTPLVSLIVVTYNSAPLLP